MNKIDEANKKALSVIEQGIIETMCSEKFREFLSFQSKNHRHSINNTILAMFELYAQRKIKGLPFAKPSIIKGEKQWAELGRYPKEGEEPLHIFAPIYKTYTKKSAKNERFDPKSLTVGEFCEIQAIVRSLSYKTKSQFIYTVEMESFNGSNTSGYFRVKTSEELTIGGSYLIEGYGEIYKNLVQLMAKKIVFLSMVQNSNDRKVVTGFKLVEVYDFCQTDGKPIPSICEPIEGNSKAAKEVIDILENIIDIPIIQVEDLTANGYFNFKKMEIGLKSDLSINHKAKTLVHEYSHYIIHTLKSNGLDLSKYIEDRKGNYLYAVEEVIVESIAFMVCNYFGIDTSEYSFEYITSWSGGNITMIKNVLSLIQKYFAKIVTKIENAKSNMSVNSEVV